MRLEDLVKPIEQMTEDELFEHLRGIRHRRSVERPAARARAERVEKKESKSRLSKFEKLLSKLSVEERSSLLEKAILEGFQNAKDSPTGNAGEKDGEA